MRKLSHLAFTMQQDSLSTESKQVRIDYDEACDLLAYERAEDILKAGIALSVLDEDIAQYEISFFHQLLQEFFAARELARNPNPALVQVAWAVDKVRPTLGETLAGLGDGDPLPPLPQTGWEETTLTAAPMAQDPYIFIRDLMPHNLPLAARCAASADVRIDPELKAEIQAALIARTQDMQADLRGRIAAGLALGELGDPRFERRKGEHGDYLLPPLIPILAGDYPMGDDNSSYEDEKPAHSVTLEAFSLGQFPVTNAEYALFMEAGGYEDEQWWETEEARAWLRGEGSTEGQKASVRDIWQNLQSWSDDRIREFVTQNHITSEQADAWIDLKSLASIHLEETLDERYPEGQQYRHSEFWYDARFNNPAQLVVGLTWFEACAYCQWFSAQTGMVFALPTEVEWENAARGTENLNYPYGNDFDMAKGNTVTIGIGQTNAVGIFPQGASPYGVLDMSGNVWEWCLNSDNDTSDIDISNKNWALRGGSWHSPTNLVHAACRLISSPYVRNYAYGFRLCRPLLFVVENNMNDDLYCKAALVAQLVTHVQTYQGQMMLNRLQNQQPERGETPNVLGISKAS